MAVCENHPADRESPPFSRSHPPGKNGTYRRTSTPLPHRRAEAEDPLRVVDATYSPGYNDLLYLQTNRIAFRYSLLLHEYGIHKTPAPALSLLRPIRKLSK